MHTGSPTPISRLPNILGNKGWRGTRLIRKKRLARTSQVPPATAESFPSLQARPKPLPRAAGLPAGAAYNAHGYTYRHFACGGISRGYRGASRSLLHHRASARVLRFHFPHAAQSVSYDLHFLLGGPHRVHSAWAWILRARPVLQPLPPHHLHARGNILSCTRDAHPFRKENRHAVYGPPETQGA